MKELEQDFVCPACGRIVAPGARCDDHEAMPVIFARRTPEQLRRELIVQDRELMLASRLVVHLARICPAGTELPGDLAGAWISAATRVKFDSTVLTIPPAVQAQPGKRSPPGK